MRDEKVSSVQAVRLWKIEKEAPQEIDKSKLNLEERLERWIASNISIVSPDLLVIGRQVETSFGGLIDLLCMEENGDIVILELKRDKTHREITAQVLDYATWVKGLTAEQIETIASRYFEDISFEEAYQKKFNHDLPDSINEEHKMLVVGSEIDSTSRRIISYLSETYGVAMNAITFNYFKDGDREYLARIFLIEPSKAEIAQSIRPTKRRSNLTYAQLRSFAEEKGIAEIYARLDEGLSPLFDSKGTTLSSLAFSGLQNGKMNTILSIVPRESSTEEGLKFRVYSKRLGRFLNTSEEEIESILPMKKSEWKFYQNAPPEYSGYEGFFENIEEAEKFIDELSEKKRTQRETLVTTTDSSKG